MPAAIEALPFAIASALLVFAVIRPWHALVVLLALLPANAFFVLVVGDVLGLEGLPRLAWAAWHDALAVGIVLVAASSFVRDARERGFREVGRVEWLALAVMGLGLAYVLVAPHRLTAAYAYRTLYEPIVLCLAVVHLARVTGLPSWVTRRSAAAVLAGGLCAALAAWPQVYIGGFAFLDSFYHEVGERLSPSYIATAINQPRAVGTFNSPNEFGAYMALSIGVLLAPGILRLRSSVRLWILVILGLALFLSFSRSGWLSTAVITAALVWLARPALPSRRALVAHLRTPRTVLSHGAPLALGAVLLVFVAASSGAGEFVESTVGGKDPSFAHRPVSAGQGIAQVEAHPFGVGLGMAGPKSVRFGEGGSEPILASETWYIAYAMQVGVGGLALLLALVTAVAARLWSHRQHPWPVLGLAAGAGLATGALFIPIIDDPAVATPLWVILALGLAQTARVPALARLRPSHGQTDGAQVSI